MRLKDILKEAANAKMAFKRPPGTSLTEDKPKTAPSDEKLKSMGNKNAAETSGHELTGVTRSLDKEKDFKLKKRDVDATNVTDGYGNDVEIDPANPRATEQRADAEVENLKEDGAIRLRKLMARILPEAEEPEPTDNGEANPSKKPIAPQGQEHQKSDSKAADDAHNLGLVAKPYGNWADDTGKVVAKTVKGNLVKIDPNEKHAKNADAPTDNGEVTPSQAPQKTTEPKTTTQNEPSTKLSSMVTDRQRARAEKMAADVKEAESGVAQHGGSAMNALKAYSGAFKTAYTAGDRDKTAEMGKKYDSFARGLTDLAAHAAADLYETAEELKSRGQANHPVFKYIDEIGDMASLIEEDRGTNDVYSPRTKATLYDISKKYNEQLAANSQGIDPDEVEADKEELDFLMQRDQRESEPISPADNAADKADVEYDDWASSGKPKFWHGRRMRH